MRPGRFFLLIFLCFLLLFSACSPAKPDREAQCPLPFAAVLEGTRGELAFAAEVRATAAERSIRYTAPASLAGLTVTQTETGISVAQGSFRAEEDSAAGFLAPLDLLTSPAALAAVEEHGGEKTLTYTDGSRLILQKDGTPRAAAGNGIFFTVSDFQKLP